MSKDEQSKSDKKVLPKEDQKEQPITRDDQKLNIPVSKVIVDISYQD